MPTAFTGRCEHRVIRSQFERETEHGSPNYRSVELLDFAAQAEKPVAADFDGDGKADVLRFKAGFCSTLWLLSVTKQKPAAIRPAQR